MKIKKIILSATLLCLFVAAISVSIYSCKDPMAGIDLIADIDFTKATIGVQFINAKTGENIGFTNPAQAVTVEFAGTNSSNIVDISRATTFMPAQGFMSLALKEGVTPSEASPVRFTIVANAPGYFTSTLPVTIYKEGGVFLIVKMIEIANPPDGVGVGSVTIAQDPVLGTITSDSISISAIPRNIDLTATMKVPIGEKFYTKSRIDGSLTQIQETIETAIYYDCRTSYEGYGEPQLFKGACSVFINMYSYTNNVYRSVNILNKPIQVTMGLPTNASNGNDLAVVVGDTVPIWSWDQWDQFYHHGNWKVMYEGHATVVAGTGANAGNLQVVFPVTHFSPKWYVGWTIPVSCTTTPVFKNTGFIEDESSRAFLITDPNNTIVYSGVNTFDERGCKLRNVGYNKNFTLQICYNNSWCDIDKQLPFNDCSGGPYNVNLTEFKKVNIHISLSCSDRPGTIFRPTISVYCKDLAAPCPNASVWSGNGYPRWSGFRLVKGEASTGELKVGHTYDILIIYNYNLFRQNNYTVTSSDITINQVIDAGSCSKLY